MLNVFTGIQGYRIHLDENGDAQFNLTLMDIRNSNCKYIVGSDLSYVCLMAKQLLHLSRQHKLIILLVENFMSSVNFTMV